MIQFKGDDLYIDSLKLPAKDKEGEQIELMLKMEQFLHDRFMLYLWKKTHDKYKHKYFLFLAGWQNRYGDMYPNLNWQNVPDAMVCDTLNQTYTTIQYQYVWPANMVDVKIAPFVAKYKNSIHLINMTTIDQTDYGEIYPIVQGFKSEFDVRIRTYHRCPETYISAILKEVNELDQTFIEQQGLGIRHQFFQDFSQQDYSKFKYDREFVQEFYEFIQSHIEKSSNIYLSTYIPGTSSTK